MDRLELAMQQLAAVKAARDAALMAERVANPALEAAAAVDPENGGTAATLPKIEEPGARLLRLKGENQVPNVASGVTFTNGVEVINTPVQNCA